MYIKGASRRNAAFWVKHLQDTKGNERTEMIEARGLAATDLRGMLKEMQQDAELTRCKNFMYIAIFNPCVGETLTPKQWERAYEIFEQERGIPEGQQRIVIEHEKKGRVHHHVIWNRIDAENMRAFPDSLNLRVCTAAEEKIEHELGLEKTPAYLNRDPDLPPLQRNPKSWEMFRGQRSGLDPRDVTAEVTALFRESKDGPDFAAKLHEKGYELCQGDKRGFVILDQAGEAHSLARRIEGVKTKELSAFMAGVDREALPTVTQAQERYRREAIANDREEFSKVQKLSVKRVSLFCGRIFIRGLTSGSES